MDPIAQLICNSPAITPITLGHATDSILMYADTLLFLSNVEYFLPSTIQILEDFGRLSGFKMNYSKSMPLLIIATPDKADIPTNIPAVDQDLFMDTHQDLTCSIS